MILLVKRSRTQVRGSWSSGNAADGLLIKWSSFDTALCSSQWTQDHGGQSDTSIYQGGVYTGRGSRRSLFVKVKISEEDGRSIMDWNSSNLCSKMTVRRDIHLNDLLVLPPNSDLHDHPMYISGELILQVYLFILNVIIALFRYSDINPSNYIGQSFLLSSPCLQPGKRISHHWCMRRAWKQNIPLVSIGAQHWKDLCFWSGYETAWFVEASHEQSWLQK